MIWMNRLLCALLIAAAVAWLPREFTDTDASADLARIEQERRALVAGNTTLEAQISALEAEVDALHVTSDDPASQARAATEIQRIAREDLNLIRRGEVVFELLPPAEQQP
ncbi:MAG: hypothetical protein B7733_24605 [Myxococcales bacterium FL481]|nr:MAG: hypothetical protein B7733_24605 [Myxococcales bacterium FL481]